MTKRILMLAAVLLVPLATMAWTPRFSYGLEWGYTGTFLRTYQHNYIYSAGSRIIENDSEWWYYSNGGVLANAGIDIGSKVNLSLYSGLIGVYSRRWMIPAELRTRWCPMGLEKTGPLVHGGVAAAFPVREPLDVSARLNLGGGYRVGVYKHLSVDFLASFVLTLDHETITDPDTGARVEASQIVRNLAEYWGINLGFAINF